MALGNKAKEDNPLKRAKIVVCTHINAQTAVKVETLVTLGTLLQLLTGNIVDISNDDEEKKDRRRMSLSLSWIRKSVAT